MQTQYNEIINSFVDKYGLSRGQVVAEIEKTFSTMLSRWYGTGTVVLFADDYLQALHYAKQSGIPLQNQLDLVSVRGWNMKVKSEIIPTRHAYPISTGLANPAGSGCLCIFAKKTCCQQLQSCGASAFCK